jgi:hypothetical protein
LGYLLAFNQGIRWRIRIARADGEFERLQGIPVASCRCLNGLLVRINCRVRQAVVRLIR